MSSRSAARRAPRPIEVVEAAHHLARQLEVRHLVVAHRHEVGVVDDDVGGLQQRVAEEADARQVALGELLDLLLVGRHALQPRNRRDHLQQQVQLGVLGHHRLHEDRAPLGVDAGANPVGDVVDRAVDDVAGVGEVAGERVPVGDEVEAVVVAPAAPPSSAARPTRCPRCSFPVGRMPDTTRFRSVTAANPGRSVCTGPIRMADSTPGEHQRVEQRRSRTGAAARSRRASRRRQDAHQHVAAVERRDRDHVEHGQQHVDAPRSRTASPSRPLAHARRPPQHVDDHRARSTASSRLLTGPAARDDREVAARATAGCGSRPAPASPSRSAASRSSIATSGNSIVPIRSMCTAGLSDSRPSMPRGRIAELVGRPRVRRLVKRQRGDEDGQREDDLQRNRGQPKRTSVPQGPRVPQRPAGLRSDGGRPARAKCVDDGVGDALAPTTGTSAPRGWRAARRRRCRSASAACLRRRGPTPGIASSSERRSRLARAWRWKVTAKRCASSRIRCSSRSAGAVRIERERLIAVAHEDELLLLGQADRDQVRQADLLERLVGRVQLPLPPSITIRSGNGPPSSSTRA